MTNFDQRGQHVNEQFNINIEAPQSLKPEYLLKEGIKLFEAKSFLQAKKLLMDVIKDAPSLYNAYYYLALVLLKGRRPKVLKRNEIEEIDEILCAATSMGDSDGTILWFRALLRHDYYNGNKMRCPFPSVNEIISSISSDKTDFKRLQNLLIKLPMADNQMYNDLAKQLF